MFILGVCTSPASEDVLLISDITVHFSYTNLQILLHTVPAFASVKISLSILSSSPYTFSSPLHKALFNFSPSCIPSKLLKHTCISQIGVTFLFTWKLAYFYGILYIYFLRGIYNCAEY